MWKTNLTGRGTQLSNVNGRSMSRTESIPIITDVSAKICQKEKKDASVGIGQIITCNTEIQGVRQRFDN